MFTEPPQIKPDWYIITTASRSEDKVKSQLIAILGDKINDVFIPVYEDNGQVKNIIPNYVFVSLRPGYDCSHLKDAVKQISQAIRLFSEIATPHHEIEAMKTASAHYKTGANLSVDQTVKITAGPFVDFTGQIESYNNNQVSIRLQILGRKTLITVADNEVEIV